ncbi:TfoX/Sxy family protein [Pseudomonas gingeri]
MSSSRQYLNFVLEQLEPLGSVASKRMFGCTGIYLNGLMFALIDGDDGVYVKSDADSVGFFEAAQCYPFTYRSRGREVALSYWSIPHSALDDRDELLLWARRGVEAAVRASQKGRLSGS